MHSAASQWDHLVQEGRVHRSLYTDPSIFAEEMIKIFGGTWVYLGHESEISKPNDFVVAQSGSPADHPDPRWQRQNQCAAEPMLASCRDGVPPARRLGAVFHLRLSRMDVQQ